MRIEKTITFFILKLFVNFPYFFQINLDKVSIKNNIRVSFKNAYIRFLSIPFHFS